MLLLTALLIGLHHHLQMQASFVLIVLWQIRHKYLIDRNYTLGVRTFHVLSANKTCTYMRRIKLKNALAKKVVQMYFKDSNNGVHIHGYLFLRKNSTYSYTIILFWEILCKNKYKFTMVLSPYMLTYLGHLGLHDYLSILHAHPRLHDY